MVKPSSNQAGRYILNVFVVDKLTKRPPEFHFQCANERKGGLQSFLDDDVIYGGENNICRGWNLLQLLLNHTLRGLEFFQIGRAHV